MKLKIGFFGGVLLGLTNGCVNKPKEPSCEFVDTCIAQSANTSSITCSLGTKNNQVESSSPIGYSARWLTNRKCDLNGNACHWEISQFPQYGDAFRNNGGQIVIDTPGYYRINVALYNAVHDPKWIEAHLKKNGDTLAIGASHSAVLSWIGILKKDDVLTVINEGHDIAFEELEYRYYNYFDITLYAV